MRLTVVSVPLNVTTTLPDVPLGTSATAIPDTPEPIEPVESFFPTRVADTPPIVTEEIVLPDVVLLALTATYILRVGDGSPNDTDEKVCDADVSPVDVLK
jgi:hypothetical protein